MTSTPAQRPFGESAAQSVDSAIRSAQRASNQALDSMSDSVRHSASMLHDTADSVQEMARRSAEAVRERSLQMREQALAASEHARGYIREEPMKSVVVAAALGAGLAALWMWMARRHTLH